jgi:riboflavin synthase alpha subunit
MRCHKVNVFFGATTLGRLNTGDSVNLEVDIIARHLEQLIKNK